jgi:hypothetical protein
MNAGFGGAELCGEVGLGGRAAVGIQEEKEGMRMRMSSISSSPCSFGPHGIYWDGHTVIGRPA